MPHCNSWHAVDGELVQCGLSHGHPLQHATEIGEQRKLVTWEHNGGYGNAILVAAEQRSHREREERDNE
jgi:hypothetical protein